MGKCVMKQKILEIINDTPIIIVRDSEPVGRDIIEWYIGSVAAAKEAGLSAGIRMGFKIAKSFPEATLEEVMDYLLEIACDVRTKIQGGKQ